MYSLLIRTHALSLSFSLTYKDRSVHTPLSFVSRLFYSFFYLTFFILCSYARLPFGADDSSLSIVYASS